jgi:hypothetical protein
MKKCFTINYEVAYRATEEELKWGAVCNINDSFFISEGFRNKMEVFYDLPKSYLEKVGGEKTQRVKPSLGSKLIGAYRNKGCVSLVLKHIPVILFDLETKEEKEYLTKYVTQMGNRIIKEHPLVTKETELLVVADIVCNPSTGRDNLAARVLASILEYKSICLNEIIYLTEKEVQEIDIMELAEEREWCCHKCYLLDKETLEVAFEFGTVPVLLEDFFWQPQHDMKYKSGEKDISLTYTQARDCFSVMFPIIAEAIEESFDIDALAEFMLSQGIMIEEVVFSDEDTTNKGDDEKEDDFDIDIDELF